MAMSSDAYLTEQAAAKKRKGPTQLVGPQPVTMGSGAQLAARGPSGASVAPVPVGMPVEAALAERAQRPAMTPSPTYDGGADRPSPTMDTSFNAKRRQVDDINAQMYGRTQDIIRAKQGNPNGDLLTEKALLQSSMTPLPDTSRTPEQIATNAKAKDRELADTVLGQIQALPPGDSQTRRDLQRGYDGIVKRLYGQTPVEAGAAVQLGNPLAGFMAQSNADAGAKNAAAGYAKTGVEGAASAGRAAESRGFINEAMGQEFMRRRDARLAQEQAGSTEKGLTYQNREALMQQHLKETRAMSAQADAARVQAEGAADPATVAAERKTSQTQSETDAVNAQAKLIAAQGQAKNAGAVTNAQVAQNNRTAAHIQHGIDEDWLTSANNELGALGASLSSFSTGDVVGNAFGGTEKAGRDANQFLTNRVGTLERMSQTHPDVAKQQAAVWLSQLPPTNADGTYGSAAQGLLSSLPVNVRNRQHAAQLLNEIRTRLAAIAQ